MLQQPRTKEGGGDGIAQHDAKTGYTRVGLPQDKLSREVLRQGGYRATDPLDPLDLSCQPVTGQLPVMNPVFVTCLELGSWACLWVWWMAALRCIVC